ncbi:MAG: Stk1 family PASTA domain-containing Ser/Thr kinase [Eubacterium sp.]|nr:Stk1 family PASTA domain-containing Ser/Thr kinase [Eubacterium sp.]
MENYVGKRLDGRYEVREIIGVGGMSVVYKAYDNVDDRIVAIKVLKDEYSANEEFKRRFKNESKAIALLSHPNIVKVYDVNLGEKLQYIVMEYIDGITLKEYINKQGAITWNDALFFMTQILRAVQHAHDKGIVHRDIKPQNIILLPTGNIKVTDFGIARFSRSETKTLTEQAIGSVHYIAPEQAKGEYTDEKADIYSLGVVLYEMLSGTVPFEADSAVSVALMQLQADAQKLTDINPDIPVGLEQICIRAMQKNPADRYQTATEMLLDIEEIVMNPNTVFNYTVKVDTNPTKVVSKNDIKPVKIEEEKAEYDDDYDSSSRKKKVATVVIIGVIVLIAAIILIVLAFTNGIQKNTYRLESFVGMSYDAVIDANEKGAYKYKFIQEQVQTDEAEPGIIIRQSPEVGSKVLEGSEVTLFVAAAKDGLTVPNVYGATLEQAKTYLERTGFINFKVLTVSSENVDEGKVIYTEPKADSVADASDEIVIYVSTGPSTTEIKTYKMPGVYGLSQSGARAFLEKYGFTNISFITQDSSMPKDTVISQSPSEGEQVKEDDAIKIIISSGVTTTTTARQLKISLSVRLPKVLDENGEYVKDTVSVSVDGNTRTSNIVELDGSQISFSVTGEAESIKNITVALKDTVAAETKDIDGKKDESITYDFRKYSKDNTTTTTKAKAEEPVSDDSNG